MKNGVLSNFTRSHISSDRVRSGYEIRLNSEWISISLFLAVRAVSRKSLSTFLNNIPAAIAWHMICSCRLSFTPISPAKKRYRFTPVTLCHAGFYLRHVTHCNVMGIASLGIVGLFPDPREILHECCFSINSWLEGILRKSKAKSRMSKNPSGKVFVKLFKVIRANIVSLLVLHFQ